MSTLTTPSSKTHLMNLTVIQVMIMVALPALTVVPILVTLMITMMMTTPLMIPTPFLHQPTIAKKVTDSLKPLCTSQEVFKASAETPHPNPRKSRLENLTLLTVLTLGNSATSLSPVIFTSWIVHMSMPQKRILFILSYLKGSALSWFEPGLNNPTGSAHWMWNYQAFLSELEDNFGPHDPIGDAEKSLNELQMKKSTRIVKYNVDS